MAISQTSIRGNSLYTLVKSNNWTEAAALSSQMGGYLVAINSAEENQFLVDSFADMPVTRVFDKDFKIVWIGLTDQQEESKWEWVNGEAVDYTNWYPGTPNGDGDYADMAIANTTDAAARQAGDWNDAPIGGEIYPYVNYGVAEIPVTSSISFSIELQEGGEEFETFITLEAGTQESGNLAEGSTVYWQISGVTQEDLASGDISGSGVITNGRLILRHSLIDDGVAEDEDFVVRVYSDAEMQNQIGDTTETLIIDGESSSVIGEATSDASPIIISGDLLAPSVESYGTTTTGRGKKKITVGSFTEVTIDQSGPLDALVVNGGESNNVITGNGFTDNTKTSIDETRSAFTGVLVIDGKGGADTITGGASGTNWLIGGGTADGTVDTLTGVALATDIFDLRKDVGGSYQDAYGTGSATINGYDISDYIVLSNDASAYLVNNVTETIERTNKRGKVTGVDTFTKFEIRDAATDNLIATVNGSTFTESSSASDLKIIYGQGTQDPFSVDLLGSGAII